MQTAKQTPDGRRKRAQPQLVTRMDDSPKGRILRAASHLFVTNGYGGTSVRELASAVGIQSGSLFHHFVTKQDILETVMVEVIELNTERMRTALLGSATPLGQLRALVMCELNSIHGDTSEAMSLLMREWRSLDEDARARVLVLRDRYEQLWLDTLTSARDGLVPAEPFILRRLIQGMLTHSTYWFDREGAMDLAGLADTVMTLLQRKESH